MVEPIFDYQFRLILIGDSTVGKSSLLKFFTDGKFAEVWVKDNDRILTIVQSALPLIIKSNFLLYNVLLYLNVKVFPLQLVIVEYFQNIAKISHSIISENI